MHRTAIDSIVKDYYKIILKYCCKCMKGNLHAAEDCTQEVFLIFHQKANSLDFTKDIQPWLYRTADRVMKAYLRKHPETVDIDAIPEIAEESEPHDSVLDVLTENEQELVESYYSGMDKQLLAKKLGITLQSLYLKVARIKKKLMDELDKTNKL